MLFLREHYQVSIFCVALGFPKSLLYVSKGQEVLKVTNESLFEEYYFLECPKGIVTVGRAELEVKGLRKTWAGSHFFPSQILVSLCLGGQF
jgi:hypothetical protein